VIEQLISVGLPIGNAVARICRYAGMLLGYIQL